MKYYLIEAVYKLSNKRASSTYDIKACNLKEAETIAKKFAEDLLKLHESCEIIISEKVVKEVIQY